MAVGVAFKAFFAALFDSKASGRIADALNQTPSTEKIEQKPKPHAKPKLPARSDAITLLSTLQREARLIDLVQEPLEQFEDAQVGAAAREVLRDCKKTLDRMFAISAIEDSEEGETISVDANISPNRVKISGSSSGSKGTVTHRGWKATSCDLPKWSGKPDDALLLAPVEVEVT